MRVLIAVAGVLWAVSTFAWVLLSIRGDKSTGVVVAESVAYESCFTSGGIYVAGNRRTLVLTMDEVPVVKPNPNGIGLEVR